MKQHVLVRSEPDFPHFHALVASWESKEKTALELWRGRGFSFAEVSRSARAAARFFREQGARRGDRIVLIGGNLPQWVMTFLGCRLGGLVSVPLDPQLDSSNVLNLARFVEARAIVTDRSWYERLKSSKPPFFVYCFEDPNGGPGEIFEPEAPGFSDLPDPDPSGIAAVLFTSGTTGDPKGVMLSEANLLSNAQTLARLGIEREEDLAAVVLPLHHIYALTVGILAPLCVGATIVFPGTLKGTLLRQCFKERGVTILPAVPLLLERMKEGIEQGIRRSPFPLRFYARCALGLSRFGRLAGISLGRILCKPIRRNVGPSLRVIVSAGASLSAQTASFFLDLGFTLVEGYGLTETSPAVAVSPPDAPKPGSVGLPIPGAELRFGPPQADGSGEIMVRGPMVMQGYWGRDDLTRQVFSDGFFRTGDLGKLDRDGYLWITGRLKELIVLPSGKNVYPEEVEKHYLKAPSVQEICVLQDPENPNLLHGVVVPEQEFVASSGETLRTRLRFDLEEAGRKLPSYLRLSGFTVQLDPLPRTRLGKIKRSEVAVSLQSARKKTAAGSPSLESDQTPGDPAAAAVLSVLSELAGKPVGLDEHLELEAGLDSLRRLEAVTRIEAALGLDLTPEELAGISTARDLVELTRKGPSTKQRSFSWRAFLETEPEVPLQQVITIRGGLGTSALRAMGWALLRAYIGLRFGMRVEGRENLPAGPCIVAPNHVSLFDAPVIYVALPRRVRRSICFFGARTQFTSPLRRFMVKPARVILTDQLVQVRESLRYGAAALKRGLSLCIFPEGGRAPGRSFEPARPGAGLLARELGVPVVPVLIRGTECVWSRLADPPPRGRIFVYFGRPIGPEVFRGIEEEEQLGRPWNEALERLAKEKKVLSGR